MANPNTTDIQNIANANANDRRVPGLSYVDQAWMQLQDFTGNWAKSTYHNFQAIAQLAAKDVP